MEKKGIIVVTGCSGRIGTAVAKRFGATYQIVGFDVSEPREKDPHVAFRKIDLSSDDNVKEGFEWIRQNYGNKITSVIHLAAYYSFSKGSPEKYDAITVQGTRRVLEAAQTFECDQFIFSSTQLIYKPTEVGVRVNENSTVAAKWDYPESKVKTEALMHEKHGNLPIVVLQIVGCYDDMCHSIPISNQIQRIYEHQLASRLFPGDLTHGAPFMHLDDLAEALWLCVQKRKEIPREIKILVGEDQTVSYDKMQREISRLLFGKEIKTMRIPKWFAKMGAWIQNHVPIFPKTFIKPWMIDLADDHYQLDITRAKTLLGWTPKHFVLDALPVMIDALKKDPIGWYKFNGLTMPASLQHKLEKSAHG